MAKVLIVYSTNTGSTKRIGDFIAEGVQDEGHEVNVVDVKNINTEADLDGYDAYIFGSPTYHGEMMKSMKTMLFLAQKANLNSKVGASFGAFEWSGEAADRIYDTMENVFNMKMVGVPLKIGTSYMEDDPKKAKEYGRGLAKKLG